jgi:hypothetical protein
LTGGRRDFLLALGAALALPRPALAQQPGRSYRLGWLSSGALRTEPYNVAFVERLRELGFVEGQNLTIEFRNAEGQAQRVPDLAATDQLKVARAGAARLGLELHVHEFEQGPYDYDAAFAAFVRARAEALLALATAFFVPARRHIAELALKHRLPSMFNNDLLDRGRRASVLRTQLHPGLPPHRRDDRHDPERCQAGRHAGGAANGVRHGTQPPDRPHAPAHHPRLDPAPRRPGDRVSDRPLARSTFTWPKLGCRRA